MGYYGLGPGTTVADQLSQLEQLLRKLPLAQALEALDLLEKITKNVLQNPTEEKFRQVKITNAKLAQVLSIPAAQDIMREMGWEFDAERMVLPNSVKLDFQKHVGKIIDAKPYYKKALEEEKKAKKLLADPKKAEALRQLELDRREREADRSSKSNLSNFPAPLVSEGCSPAAAAAAARANPAQAPSAAAAAAASRVASADLTTSAAATEEADRQYAEQLQREESAGAPAQGGAGRAEQLQRQESAHRPFAAGDLAEVAILDGRHAGNWVSCQILGPGSTAGTYTIHVLPTTDFDNANGFANHDLPDVEVEHLRQEAASRPGPCSFDSYCTVS